jgi:hypothetical protein
MLPTPLDGGNKDGILGGGVNKYYGGIYIVTDSDDGNNGSDLGGGVSSNGDIY